jgi:ectoine hydroxylase-related dioxygenase (phytanoyl-CoA dioxygenase family)
MNIAVFLDDVTAANGTLLILAGSHKTGVIEAGRQHAEVVAGLDRPR